MSNPTTPFSWQMPTNTDLVTDLPADFEVFGQAVATSMADLLGGTTGQVLAKASNTDMDFVWSADAAGMVNPMTTTGDVIYSSPGSTPVRLGIGSTGQGLSIVAGIPAWTASATSTLTTTGDMLYASAANTLARRAVGTTGQVLTVAGGVPTWAAPAGGGLALAQIATGVISGASLTISGLASYDTLILQLNDVEWTTAPANLVIELNSGAAGAYASAAIYSGSSNGGQRNNPATSIGLCSGLNSSNNSGSNAFVTTMTNCKSVGFTNYSFASGYNDSAYGSAGNAGQGIYQDAAAIASLRIRAGGGATLTAGTYILWGA